MKNKKKKSSFYQSTLADHNKDMMAPEVQAAGIALKNAMSQALFFANEVYVTQGAVHYAVLFRQSGGKEKRNAEDLSGGDQVNYALDMPKEMLLHSFIENVGDSLKVFNELTEHEEPDQIKLIKVYSKASKYIDRMMDSAALLLGEELFKECVSNKGWGELENVRQISGLTANIKANIDYKGAAELAIENNKYENGVVGKLLSCMRLGKPATYAQFFEGLKQNEKEELTAKKLDLKKNEDNWASRKTDALDVKSEKERKALMDGSGIKSFQDLKDIVIDFGAELPKFYYKYKDSIASKKGSLEMPAEQKKAAVKKAPENDTTILDLMKGIHELEEQFG